MSEKKNKLDKPNEENRNPEKKEARDTPRSGKRKSFVSRRSLLFLCGFFALLFVFLSVLVFALYRTGYIDSYIKDQFVVAFDEMGITFDPEEFNVTYSPLELNLKNAVFSNKKTGEKLFSVETAKFGMTILDLWELKTIKNVNVDTTDLNGLEIWLKFDETGKSNFEGVEILPPKNSVRFQYASTKLSIRNGIVHFGDTSRSISGDARNVVFLMEPENMEVPDAEKRYKFDLTSTDSTFTYDKSRVEPIDIRANGVADDKSADIASLKITSPVGSSNLSGRVSDWQAFKYDFKINSTIDLTKTSEVFPIGTALSGIGEFEGTVKGEGETYQIDGEILSHDLAAANVRLKALRITPVIDGKSSVYNGHGKAVAELLTFEDFIIHQPQLTGNIRGTGTDFKWFGELKAAAAKTSFGTLAGLYVSDADAEYGNGKFTADFRGFSAKNFSASNTEITSLKIDSAKIDNNNGTISGNIPSAHAEKVDVEGATLHGVNVKDAKVNNRGSETDVDARDVKIDRLETKDAKLKNVTAKNVAVKNRGRNTDATATNVEADGVEMRGANVGKINASGVDVKIVGNETKVYSNNVKIAKVTTNAAVLGSLNVAGVRLTVREGRIEGTSEDFDAGNVDLPSAGELENVAVKSPVFVLEPSGRYRASLDMSLGGGMLGSVRLGEAKAAVVADNDKIELNDLTATVMDGRLDGEAVIATNQSVRSAINADFADLDLSKLLALQGGRVIPIEGKTTGRADLTFNGTDFKRASGTITADINATAGSADRGTIPVTGKIGLNAANGLFNINHANLNTNNTALDASGSFDLGGYNSNLNLAVNSTDASEVDRIFRVLNLSDSLERQLDSYQAEFAGSFAFNGELTGSLSDPAIDGYANLDSVSLNGKNLGSLASNISVGPTSFEFRDGVLLEPDGGRLLFNVNTPRTGINNVSVRANLENFDFGSLLTALSIDSLPQSLRNLNAETSGDLVLDGLPNKMQGEANLVAKNGSVSGQSFDNLESKIVFSGTLVNVEKFDAKFGDGFLVAKGTYQTDTTAFDFEANGKEVPVSRILAFFPENASITQIDGAIELNAKATGRTSDAASYDINFDGVGSSVTINGSSFSNIVFDGKTTNQILNANVKTRYRGQDQVIVGVVNFADPNMPLRAETKFDNSRLDPYIALYRKPKPGEIEVSGRATGGVFLEGNLTKLLAGGKRVFTTEFLQGNAQFTQFDLMIDETPLNATEPIDIRFNMSEVSVGNAKFAGGGSNLIISGTKALNDNGINNLSLDGKVNLRILNGLSKNLIFSGLGDVAMRLTGVNRTSRLNGTASVNGASATTFIGSERLTFERLQGNVIFTTNQVQLQRLTGFLGGGRIVARGGASLNGLEIDRYRVELKGTNITARLPKDFVTTGNADIQINARRIAGKLDTLISGDFYAKRSTYSKNIDLADLLSSRSEGSLSQSSSGASVIGVPKLDIRVLGRNALHVHNNLAELTASTDLRVAGDIEFPTFTGRIIANSGTAFFRNDRYIVQRAVVTFPPNSAGFDPVVNIQAESQISGYQVFVNLSGKITDTESLVASVRSNPSLPQADVVSLITTGSLSNTGNGIPTYAQSGLNTAAELLADEIVNKPIAKATDKLFGLNKFKLDPIISGERRNPTARLTVGRQINRNLLVTYSTNLSQDQNQVLALEYRVSNRLSFVAQYEQRSLTNVTRNRNNFSFEIRLRRRF